MSCEWQGGVKRRRKRVSVAVADFQMMICVCCRIESEDEDSVCGCGERSFPCVQVGFLTERGQLPRLEQHVRSVESSTKHSMCLAVSSCDPHVELLSPSPSDLNFFAHFWSV